MVIELLLDVVLLKQTLDINLVRFVELVLLFLFNVFVDHIVDLLVSHIVLFDLVGNFVEHTLVLYCYTQQSLLEFLKRQP